MDGDIWQAIIDEVCAVSAVHVSAIQTCRVLAQGQGLTRCISVVEDGSLSSSTTENSSCSPSDASEEGLDAVALENMLVSALRKLPSMLEASPEHLPTRDATEAEWASQWQPVLTAQFSIAPEEIPEPGLRLHLADSAAEPAQPDHNMPEQADHVVTLLPPVTLTVYITPHYLTTEPPAFQLHAPWLCPAALTTAAEALTDTAKGLGSSEPVLLAWLEWLRCESAALLQDGLVSASSGSAAIRVSPQGTLQQVTVALAAFPAATLHLLLRHDRLARDAAFRAAPHHCSICMDYCHGSAGIKPPCGHWHCTSCMRDMAAACMADGDIAQLRCPQVDCREALPVHVLQLLLEPADMERWEELTLKRTLAAMRDVVFCPRCQVAAVESQDWASCPGCGFAFCSMCYQAYHPGVQCATPEQRLQVLEMRSKRLAGNDQVVAEARRLKMELEDEVWVRQHSKKCPSCDAAISKSGGCNKVRCAICKGYMCWKCEAYIEGYEHFRDGGCELMEEAEVEAWGRQWARMVAEHQGMAPPGHEEGRQRPIRDRGVGAACPSCRAWTEKEQRNNHLKCRRCQADFCFLCGTVMRGKASVRNHFGKARGCAQHS